MSAKKAAAMIAIKADPKDLDKGLGEARKKLRAFGSGMKKIGGKVFGGAKGALSSIGQGLGIQAATGITETVKGVMDFERNLVRLQIAAGKTPAEMNKMRDAMLGVSKATGVSREDILEGTQTYVDLTGDIDGATAAMSQFARISAASGASVSDVATATAALKDSMQLDPGDIEAAFSGLIQQGKAGAVSLKDFAGELASLAPMFAKFGGSGTKGIADLGAAFQISRKGFGSASEAATGLKALMTALSRNAGKFQAAGVKIFDKDPKTGEKRFRGFVDIIDQIGTSKLAKDPTLLTKAFGSVEAQQAFDMLRGNRTELEKIYEAGQDAGAVQRDLNTYLESSSGKLDKSMNDLKLAIVEAFTPERIKAFVETVEEVAHAIGTVVDGLVAIKDHLTGKDKLAENPYGPATGDVYDSNDMVSSALSWATGGDWVGDTAQMGMQGFDRWKARLEQVAAMPGPGGASARAQLGNMSGFDQQWSDINAGGSRSERVRRAVAAAYSTAFDSRSAQEMGESGDLGRVVAGNRYLEGEGVSVKEREEIFRQMFDEKLGQLVAKIPNAIREGMKGAQVKLDNSAVQKTINNAPVHRGGGG